MARIQHYDIGDIWKPQATFTVGGAPTDPTALIVRVKEPDGTVTVTTENNPAAPAPPITRSSAGVFVLTQILDDAGHWYVRFEGTGVAAAAEESEAIVDPSQFFETAQLDARALVTMSEAKDWLNQLNIDTAEDLELARVINDLSDRFHQEAGREFKAHGTNPQARTFPVEYLGRSARWYVDGDYQGELNPNRRIVNVGDMAAAPTQVQILDYDWTTVLETVALTDITVHPTVRSPTDPIRRLELHSDVTALSAGMRVAVTGTYGFPAVPGDVRQAVLDAVVEALDRDVEHYRADFGTTTGGEGQNVVVFGNRPSILSMPPRSLAVAWRYRDPLIA